MCKDSAMEGGHGPAPQAADTVPQEEVDTGPQEVDSGPQEVDMAPIIA